MAMEEKGVYVRILEKEFRIACAENQEQALREAALYLEKQMQQIRQKGRVIGIDRMAMMAALNIAHELLTLKNSRQLEMEVLIAEKLRLLQEKIDGVLPKAEVSTEKWLKKENEDKENSQPLTEEIA